MLLDIVEEITANILACCVISTLIDSDVLLIALIYRLSKESGSDDKPNAIDWLELIEAVNKIQKQYCK